VDGEAEIRLSCPMQTLSKRAALLQYAETVEPSLIETFSEQVCAYFIASLTAGAFSHSTCVSRAKPGIVPCTRLWLLPICIHCRERLHCRSLQQFWTPLAQLCAASWAPCRHSILMSRSAPVPTASRSCCSGTGHLARRQGRALARYRQAFDDHHVLRRPSACFARAAT
jgi:hypothetical protein